MMTVGERIRALRKDAGWTQQDLGMRLGNRSKNSISLMETNKRRVNQHALRQLAEIFSVSVDYLVGRTEDPGGASSGRVRMSMRMPDDSFRDARILRGDTIHLEKWEELTEGSILLLRVDKATPFLRRVQTQGVGEGRALLTCANEHFPPRLVEQKAIQVLARVCSVSFDPNARAKPGDARRADGGEPGDKARR